MSDVFLYFGLGKLIIYLAQKSPYREVIKWRFLTDLFKCDLCLGVWVYSLLSLATGHYWFRDSIGYTPILSEFLTGGTASFIMWLLSEGWNSKFREFVIKD